MEMRVKREDSEEKGNILQVDAGDSGIEASNAVLDEPPPLVKDTSEEPEDEAMEKVEEEEEVVEKAAVTNNAHLIRQIGPITFDSLPPAKPTRHRDVADSMYSSVLSRPGETASRRDLG